MFTVTAPLPHVIRYINPGILEATAIRGGAITLAEAADAFLSSPRAASPHTCRAYAGAIDRLAAELGPQRPLAEVPGDEIAAALRRLLGQPRPSNVERNRAAAVSWAELVRQQETLAGPAPAQPLSRPLLCGWP